MINEQRGATDLSEGRNTLSVIMLVVLIFSFILNVSLVVFVLYKNSELQNTKAEISKIQSSNEELKGDLNDLKTQNEQLKLAVATMTSYTAPLSEAVVAESRKKSRDARRIADIKQLQLAVELYLDASGTYPKILSDLKKSNIPLVIPTDPLGNEGTGACRPNYCYAYPSASDTIKTYHLGTQLEFDSQMLKDDADFDSRAAGYEGTPFDGSDRNLIYDQKP